MIDIIKPKARVSLISITSILFAVLAGVYIYVSATGEIAGYCTTLNCECSKNTTYTCDIYNADIFYRYYYRKHAKYDTLIRNVKIPICLKESVCYVKKYSDRTSVSFIDPMSYVSIEYMITENGSKFLGVFLLCVLVVTAMVKKKIYLALSSEDLSENGLSGSSLSESSLSETPSEESHLSD